MGSLRKIIKRVIPDSCLGYLTCGTTNLSSREEWLQKNIALIPKNSRILDAGAGELRYKSFCEHLNYVSQDFGQYDGKGDGSSLQTSEWDQTKLDIVCDITSIPEPDKSFDAIMCVEVLEHLPDPVAALREFSRLIKDGGTLILTAPFCSLTHFAPYHFYTGYNRYFYEKWLPELGFKIMEIDANGNFFEYLGQEINRLPFVEGKYVTKLPFGPIKRIFKKFATYYLLNRLKELSEKNSVSEELLCFGYHIKAVRKERNQ